MNINRERVVYLVKTWAALSVVSFLLYGVAWSLASNGAPIFGESRPRGLLFNALYCSVLTLGVMTVSYIFHNAFHRWLSNQWVFILSSIITLFANAAFCVLYEVVVFHLFFIDEQGVPGPEGLYLLGFIASCLTMLVILHKHFQRLVQEQKKNKELEMVILKNQLDPHFMFNSLSTLVSLIDENPTVAHDFVMKLSRVYRYFVKHFTVDTITIHESFSFIRDYCALLEIRHPGHFKINIDSKLEESHDLILQLTLQLLTENAVKHNKHSAAAPLEISYTLEDDYLVVRNTLSPNSHNPDSTHVGLSNLQKRYELYCRKPCVINRSSDYFEVKVPIIKASQRHE